MYITKKKFEEKAQSIGGKHWATYEDRWEYYQKTIKLIKELKLKPEEILEIGSVGIKLIDGSDELDYDAKPVWQTFNPTYYHDLKSFPYPIKDKQYKLVVALRVFHHLHGLQHKCFKEIFRITDNFIMAIPYSKYNIKDVIEWAGSDPDQISPCVDTSTHIYFWKNI
jgi:hypothetical protein